jgi:hypothetical protein
MHRESNFVSDIGRSTSKTIQTPAELPKEETPMKRKVNSKSTLMIAFASLVLSTAIVNAQTPLYGTNPAGASSIGSLSVATTLAPTNGRSANVVAAFANSAGDLEVMAWHDTKTSLALLGSASVAGPAVNSVAVTGLDANRAVTADVDSTGTLSINTWEIALTSEGVSLQNGTSTVPNSATAVSITRLSSTEVVTAVRNFSGDLTVEVWNISEKGLPSLDSSASGGEVSEVAVAATNSSQVVVATRDSAGKLKVIVWAVEGGVVTRMDDYTAGAIEQLSIGASFGTENAFTATVNGSGDLEIIYWVVSPSGFITRSTTAKGGSASQVAASWLSINTPISAVCGGSSDLDVEAWGSSSKESSYNTNLGITAVAVASEGEAVVGTRWVGYFATAARGSKYQDLKIKVWSIGGPSTF